MARGTNTDLILLQIAEGLQSLAKNPDLAQKIKDSYALNEAEQKQYEDALATIAKAEQITTDQAKREAAIVDVNILIAKQEKIEAFNDDTAKELSRQSMALQAQASQNAKDAADNAKEDTRLHNVSAALDDRAENLKEAEAQLAADQADLNRRITAINAQAITA